MASRPLPDFEGLIGRVARELSTRELPFMLIGGQAVLLHGEPRLTQDIDVTLGVSPDRLDEVLQVVRAAGLTPLPEDLEPFVRETFVLPVAEKDTGLRVDFIFSSTRYEALAIGRAVRVEIGGQSVPFATAEDLILHKLFAGRPRDLEDAAGVIRRKRDELDWDYLKRWGDEFAAVAGREAMPEQIERLKSTA
ncbi:MAG: nucleotidyl transferase AbiEii/AbiGii toxin family protein [Gemmatimonadota bacterium]